MGNYFSSGKNKEKAQKADDSSSLRQTNAEWHQKGYPSKRNKHLTANARFYKNQIESYPDGDFIENILTKWKGDYERLEKHHGYIQWLFPTRGAGMNSYAQELTSHEVEAIMDDPEAFGRVLRSYEMMLDFYGMELSDKTTGEIRRAENWRDRFQHLNGSYHNYLRITRMLVFLEEFGYAHYKRPFVEFVLQEAMERGTLIKTLESCKRFWIESINIEEDREHLKDYVYRMEASYASLNQKHNAEYFGRADEMVKKSNDGSKENDHDSLGNPERMSKAEWREKMKETLKLLEEDSAYFSVQRNAELDQYRQGYPGKGDDENMRENAKFYKNELKFYPDGDLIENILTKYKGDYARLDKQYDFMQWLFPLREFGMNFTAKIHLLQRHEIKAIMDDPEAFGRVLRSYEMMLDFYGMELSDKTTGEIRRAENWRDRFHHLNRSYHNYLRITRILKFLGEFGYENYKRPFVEFVLEEAMEHGTLLNTLESCVRYWLETIKSGQDRKQLRDYVRKMEAGHTSPYEEEDSDELVSSTKVDKMIEKSKQNQEEFVSEEEENETVQRETKRPPDVENASNNAHKAAMELGDTRDPSREAEDGNDDEKEKRDSEILLKKEEERMKMQNQAMEVDSGEDVQQDVMDTSGTDNEASLHTSKSTIV